MYMLKWYKFFLIAIHTYGYGACFVSNKILSIWLHVELNSLLQSFGPNPKYQEEEPYVNSNTFIYNYGFMGKSVKYPLNFEFVSRVCIVSLLKYREITTTEDL